MKRLILFIFIITLMPVLSGCSSADHYSRIGRSSFKKGNYEAALENFQKAMEINPNSAVYYIEYAYTLIALSKNQEAIEQLDAVYRKSNVTIVKENNKRIHRGRGIAYYQMRDYDKALNEFNQALQYNELKKLNVDILYYIGSIYKEQGNYKKAISTYTTLIQKDKKDAKAYAGRALCHLLNGDYQKSQKDYDTALELEPNNYTYYFDNYHLLLQQNKEQEANILLTKISKLRVKSKQDRFYQAKLSYYMGEFDKALTQLKASAKEEVAGANFYIGEVYRSEQNYKEALSYYQIDIDSGTPSGAQVFNQASVCLMQLGEYEKAASYIKEGQVLASEPELQILNRNEIIVLEKLARYQEAKEAIKVYLDRYPEDKDAIKEAKFIDTRLPQE